MLKRLPAGLRELCNAEGLNFCLKEAGIQINRNSLINPNVVMYTWKQVSEMTAEQLIESYRATDRLLLAMEPSWSPERDRAVAQEFAERFPQPPRKTRRAHLTFEEEIKAAYLHFVEGIEQQVIAVAFTTNSGRVNEACKKIKDALKAEPGYRKRARQNSKFIAVHSRADEDDE
jgi:hypothetical protein